MSGVDPEIQFGDLEHVPPQLTLRPDHNRHLAVRPVYAPEESDLPIFVDLDALREMESHALSDMRVELGGVLLGGQFADESGRPFVVVTDCLRAQHYESTKGSFKFTHDTWEQITREREDFPAELRMVGWYHTHPDWGVFLSSLDLFICENFFNKPLDVAFVIDPCRQDRGFFQWINGDASQIRRTNGFYLTASRFRAAELDAYATQLEGQMSPDPRHSTSHSQSQPVVHLLAPGTSAPQILAILGMLGMQFCLLMLLAWRLLLPAGGLGEESSEIAGIKASVDRLAETRTQEADMDAKLDVLETVIRQATTAPEGVLKSLSEQTALNSELRGNLRAQQSLTRELETKSDSLAKALADASREDEAQKAELAKLESRVASLSRRLDESKAELVKSKEAGGGRVDSSKWSLGDASPTDLGLGAIAGAILVGAVFVVAQRVRKTPSTDIAVETRTRSDSGDR